MSIPDSTHRTDACPFEQPSNWGNPTSNDIASSQTPFSSAENPWLYFDPIFASNPNVSDYTALQNAFADAKVPFGLSEGEAPQSSFANLLDGCECKTEPPSFDYKVGSQRDDRSTDLLSEHNEGTTSSRAARSEVLAGVTNQSRADNAGSSKRRPRRSSVHVSHPSNRTGFSPSWSRRASSMGNKSFSNSLSRFTLPDENGKRRIRNDIMSIAESLPALPGLYFDKKQKGFRVRYQNVYVGWVALSRFPSIEEAYISAREIWESAKCHAEKFQTPHAAVMASYPLQKEAQASGKNRGGRPRTVTQLPPDPANWLSTTAFLTHQNGSGGSGWPRASPEGIYDGNSSTAALCSPLGAFLPNSFDGASEHGLPDEACWTLPGNGFPNALLTPGGSSKASTDATHPPNGYSAFCQPPGLSGYIADACGLLDVSDSFGSDKRTRPTADQFPYSRSLCLAPLADTDAAFGPSLDLESGDFGLNQYGHGLELPGAISFSQPVAEDMPLKCDSASQHGSRKRPRENEFMLEEPVCKRDKLGDVYATKQEPSEENMMTPCMNPLAPRVKQEGSPLPTTEISTEVPQSTPSALN